MPKKEAAALALAGARDALEAQIREAIRAYEEQHAGSFSLDLDEDDLKREGKDEPERERPLRRQIRSIVESFHRQPVVQETGMYVYKVTAIDSDGDGTAAVNVKYEYRADTGMETGSASGTPSAP